MDQDESLGSRVSLTILTSVYRTCRIPLLTPWVDRTELFAVGGLKEQKKKTSVEILIMPPSGAKHSVSGDVSFLFRLLKSLDLRYRRINNC